jgi:hypothetical protein
MVTLHMGRDDRPSLSLEHEHEVPKGRIRPAITFFFIQKLKFMIYSLPPKI